MNCKQCNTEYKDKNNKIFCSRLCKNKFRYHNDNEFRKDKIKNTINRNLNKIKLLSELTESDLFKLKLVRPELFKDLVMRID